MGLHPSSLNYVYVFCFFILFAFPYSSCKGQALPGGISDVDFNALLNDLRGSNFFTGAAILSYLARPYLQPSVTLLIPTDKSLAQALNFSPKDYPDLIKFHILEKNFNFKQLRLLPVGTWIPTALPSFGVEVTSNSAANLSLGSAQIIKPNLCPSLVKSFITCQGISAILNPKASNPPVFAGAPSSSPPIFLPPSLSPSLSPSTSPSPSPSPSIIISPSTSTSPSPSTPPPSSSPSPGFITPLPLAPSPSSSPPSPPPSAQSPSLSPTSLATPPSSIITNPEGFAPELAPAPNTAASVSTVGAYLISSIGAYILVLSHLL